MRDGMLKTNAAIQVGSLLLSMAAIVASRVAARAIDLPWTADILALTVIA
jgi:hypothetical protein